MAISFADVEAAYAKWMHLADDPLLPRLVYAMVLANRYDSDPVWALLVAASGGGKCLGLGTPVLHHDGTITPVESVRPGDLLMGPESDPRRVLSTTEGSGELFRIVPTKGKPWVCNDVHVLTLVQTGTGAVVDVELKTFLSWSSATRATWKLFQPTGISFSERAAPPIDPYFMGVWFGDGAKTLTTHGEIKAVKISKPDAEIENACRVTADQWGIRLRVDRYEGKCPDYHLVSTDCKNPLLATMRETVGDAEQVPLAYLNGSVDVRAAFLAGILDADGYLHHNNYEIVQKRRGLAEGVAFIARSLGFRVVERVKVVNGEEYQRLSIIGDGSWLPMRIQRKRSAPRQQVKNALRTGFTVHSIGQGPYFGFTLDGDGRFLLGDFTVTHNTEMLSSIAGSDTIEFVNTLTPYALASGHGDGSDSLLFRLDGRILIVEDMSAITEMDPTGRATLFSFLRAAYNGKFTRVTGKGSVEWNGKFGMLGGATLAIESGRRMESSLGERFLTVRPRINMDDQEILLDRVMQSSANKSVMRTGLRQIASDYLAQDFDTSSRTMRKSTVDLLKGAAIALSRLRTAASRDRFTREIDFPLEVGEMGTRLFTQFLCIALAAHQMETEWDDVEKMIMRLMVDSCPYVRAKLVRAIHQGKNEPRLLQPVMGMSSSNVGRHLEELRMLKIITQSRAKKWEICDDVVSHGLAIEA